MKQRRIEMEELDYVPVNGAYIWKYRRRKSSGKMFNIWTNGGIFTMVLAAFLCIAVMVIVNPYIENYVGRQSSMWIQTGLIFLITALLAMGALYIGKKGNSMQLSFARNDEGRLYVFDYRSGAFQGYMSGRASLSIGLSPVGQALSVLAVFWNNFRVGKQIERIDNERVLEKIMSSGQAADYGRRLISVKNIKQKKSCCHIYCSLLNADGRIDDTRLIINRDYDFFDELLHQFKKVQWNSAFDRKRSVSKYEKYRPLIQILDVLLPVLCVIFLAGCIASRVCNENAVFVYQKVEAVVVSCEGGAGPLSTSRKPTVTVSYNGTEYQLQNVVQGSWFYRQGELVEAYMSDGKLFANEEGVKTTQKSGRMYFIFLFGFMLLAVALLTEKSIKKDIVMKSGEWQATGADWFEL